jgi:hypothetical protein
MSLQVKCWQIRKQSKAPQAAGAIHTDFERGFICAEVYTYRFNSCALSGLMDQVPIQKIEKISAYFHYFGFLKALVVVCLIEVSLVLVEYFGHS